MDKEPFDPIPMEDEEPMKETRIGLFLSWFSEKMRENKYWQIGCVIFVIILLVCGYLIYNKFFSAVKEYQDELTVVTPPEEPKPRADTQMILTEIQSIKAGIQAKERGDKVLALGGEMDMVTQKINDLEVSISDSRNIPYGDKEMILKELDGLKTEVDGLKALDEGFKTLRQKMKDCDGAVESLKKRFPAVN